MRENIDLARHLPILHHAPGDAGRYITAGIVVVQDPVTGVYNASFHRLQLLSPDRVAIKLDYGRHLRAAFERAQAARRPLPVAVCIGVDLALYLTAATMGSQMPESADELAVAGRLSGQPLAVAKAVSLPNLIVRPRVNSSWRVKSITRKLRPRARSESSSASRLQLLMRQSCTLRRSLAATSRSIMQSMATGARPSACASTFSRRAC